MAHRVALGVGGGELAAGLPVQATRPARTAVAFQSKPGASIARLGGIELVIGNAGEEEVLPDGEADIAVAEFARDVASPRICSTVSLPTGSTTPIQFSPGCFCRWTPIWARVGRPGGRDARPRDRASAS